MPSSTTLTFSLEVGSLGDETFRVLEFTLKEAISEPYTLMVQAASGEETLAYDQMVGQPATLTVTGQDFATRHHGVVTSFNEYPDSAENNGKPSYLYDIIIEPRFKLLAYTTQNRVFQKLNVKEIVTQVLTANNLAAADVRWNLSGTYAKREFTVQYNENDLNFVSRLLEDEGIFYAFDHEGDKEVLILGDGVNAIQPIPRTEEVDFVGASGLSHLSTDHVTGMRRTQRMVTGKVTIKDYNHDTPQVNILGRATKTGQGELYAFSPHARTASDAEAMAARRAELLACGKIQLDGEGIVRAFRAGFRFKLKGDANAPFVGNYLITRVIHHGDQREGFESDAEKLIYQNQFTCIPADTVFRPPISAPKPKIHGVITARVDGPEDQYAYIDEEGRYRAKLPFDLSDKQDGQASLPIRLSQPYAGDNYGTHFPLHNGNDLVLSFVDGDVDRPIALGSIQNPSTPSPVNTSNKSESVIKTASGHIIRMDDLEKKTAIDVTTTGKHKLSMNDDAEHKEIHLTTTDKNELVMDDKNKNIRIMTPEGAHLVKLDYDKKVLSAETKYGHKLTMDDEAKKIALQTKDGHILTLDDDSKLITLQDGKGKHVLQIDAGGGLISITTEGDMELTAKGALNIQAKEINMEAKQGAMNVKAMKDLVLDGMNVSAKAKQKLALEGTVEASLKGAQTKVEGQATLDLKATGAAKLTGLKVSMEGQVMSEVKAAIVMIN